MPLPEGYALPKPGIPRTFGILSIIFATLALLQGMCGVASTLFAEPMMKAMGGFVKTTQAPIQQRFQGQLDALDKKESEAKTDEEKASIKKERESIEAQKKLASGEASFDMASEMMKDPTIRTVTSVALVMSFLLGAFLLYAGIGLVKLKESGRKAGVIWSLAAISWLLIYMFIYFVFLMPAQKPYQDKQIADLQAQMQKVNNPGMPDLAQLNKVTQAITAIVTVFMFFVIGSFPTTMLILLNGKGARAACLAGKKLDFPEIS